MQHRLENLRTSVAQTLSKHTADSSHLPLAIALLHDILDFLPESEVTLTRANAKILILSQTLQAVRPKIIAAMEDKAEAEELLEQAVTIIRPLAEISYPAREFLRDYSEYLGD